MFEVCFTSGGLFLVVLSSLVCCSNRAISLLLTAYHQNDSLSPPSENTLTLEIPTYSLSNIVGECFEVLCSCELSSPPREKSRASWGRTVSHFSWNDILPSLAGYWMRAVLSVFSACLYHGTSALQAKWVKDDQSAILPNLSLPNPRDHLLYRWRLGTLSLPRNRVSVTQSWDE